MKIFGVSKRFLRRLRFWLNIIRCARATSFQTWLGIVFSSTIDTIACSVYPPLAASPRAYVSGVFYLKNHDAYFYVRKLTDDLYNVLPGREGDVCELILKSLVTGDVFIDVGANVGYYSILAAKIVGSAGEVVALEPVSETAKILGLNINLNGLTNVKVVPKAAWSTFSFLKIYVPGKYYGMASSVKRHGTTSFTCQALPLDEMTKEIKRIKLMKIDVEGSEYQVLIGARETLRKTRHVIMEVSENSNEIERVLKNAGFEIETLRFPTYIHAERS